MNPPQVRAAVLDDVPAIARTHVRCWQQTYRGLMPDDVLDDPGFVDARARLWTHVLAVQDDRGHRTAVATADDEIVGIAMSGPPVDDDAAWSRQLFVLYVDAAHHKQGFTPDGATTVEDGVTELRMVRTPEA